MKMRWIEASVEGAVSGEHLDRAAGVEMDTLDEVLDGFRAPVMLAAWPGIGNVGVGAIDYLRRKLDARAFAEIDTRELFTADLILVENGLAKLPDVPTHTFSLIEDPPLVIFQGEVQVGGPVGNDMMGHVLDMAQGLGVQTIYTMAAYQYPMTHKDQVQVFGVSNRESLRDALVPHGVEVLEQGMVSGLNGLLLASAQERGIDAACLLATMPVYTHHMANPKSSREIVQILQHVLNISVNMSEMDEHVEKMEASMEDIAVQIQDAFSQMDEEGEVPELKAIEEDQVPQYVMKRIEELFLEAGQDKGKAQKLKQELDKWNLYQLYEDRFLNIFRSMNHDTDLDI